jgi:hypothetical protein
VIEITAFSGFGALVPGVEHWLIAFHDTEKYRFGGHGLRDQEAEEG